MNQIYILLKSLPDNSVGDLFEYSDRTGYYEHDGGTRFLPRIVEDNSEWFTPFNKQEVFEKKYTEQDMRECFRNSRRVKNPWNHIEFAWDSFDKYLGYFNTPKHQPPPHK